jgi:hypothetical protein
MNPTHLQRAVIAGGIAVALLLAFMLGKQVGAHSAARARDGSRAAAAGDGVPSLPPRLSSPAPETPPPVALTAVPGSTVDPLTLDVHFADVSNALERARTELNSATTPNHGGWVEKARADLQRAQTTFNAAAGYFNDHPESRSTLSRNANQGHLVNALEALQAALDVLAQTGGGNLAGNRDSLIGNIDATATDVVGAFNYLASGRTAPRADGEPPDHGRDLP